MRLGIIGKKVGMTQVFDDSGARIPVTVIDASDCFVTQVKSKQTDGYSAIQVGFGQRKPQNLNKSIAGHFRKANVPGKGRLKELRITEDATTLKASDQLSVNMFTKGDFVDVIGLTKGRGFTGVMKRWNYHGKDATHGTSKYFRHGGSAGTNTFPGRILKLKGNPGQYGNEQVTVANLQIVDVKGDENLILIKGALPGPNGGNLMIRAAKRLKAPEGRNWTAGAAAPADVAT